MTTLEAWASGMALVVGTVVATACCLTLIAIYGPQADDFPRRCPMLIGGWHPDVPTSYAKRCMERELEARRNSTTTSPR